MFWLKVYQLPDAGPNSRGRPIINWIPLEEGEKVQAVLPVREYSEDCFVFFATRNGTVKKTPLSDYSRPRTTGIWAINLDEGDALVDVQLTSGERDIMCRPSGTFWSFAHAPITNASLTARQAMSTPRFWNSAIFST